MCNTCIFHTSWYFIIDIDLIDIARRSAGFVLGDYVTLLSQCRHYALWDAIEYWSVFLIRTMYMYMYPHTVQCEHYDIQVSTWLDRTVLQM